VTGAAEHGAAADGELQTTALEIEHGKVVAIYVMRNHDKLRHLH
jgi:RNA polymerase sigma-70 factor (ECF subfamily)